ncbi:hypothetical protein ES708_33358 [subsurface metagenome]
MINNIQDISQIFYYILGGIGLLIAGIGAIITGIGAIITGIFAKRGATDYRLRNEEERIKDITKDWKNLSIIRKKYPLKDHRDTFLLIKIHKLKPVYLLDISTGIKRHITTRSKFDALGYNFSMVDKIDPDELTSYEEGEPI